MERLNAVEQGDTPLALDPKARLKIVSQARGAATVRLRQQRASGKPADVAHLVLDRLPEVLQDVKPVDDLPRLRCAFTRTLRVQPAPVPAHNFNLGMSREPVCDRLRRTLSNHLDNLVLLQVDDNCSVGPSLAPAPVVDPDRTDRRRGSAGSPTFQLPSDRIVARRDRKTGRQLLPRTPASCMTEQLEQFNDAASSACHRDRGVGKALDKGLPLASSIATSPATEPEVQRHRQALNGQILQTPVMPAMT